jgi:hypothetical protein
MSRLVACRVLIAASICDKLSIVRSTRSICTRCCLKMIDMIQVCSHFQSARVFIINTLPDEIEFSHSFTFFLWCFSHSFTLFRFQSLFHALSLGGDSLRAGPRKPSALSLSLSLSLSLCFSHSLLHTHTSPTPLFVFSGPHSFSSEIDHGLTLPDIISHEVFIQSFRKSQFPHKSVNLLFILVKVEDTWADFRGNRLS